ncbi:MAG TPA: MYXO-CTERM sorting domain-containing protein, partial [Kofleriaceae bacterium]
NCINSCAGVDCPAGKRCRLGVCETDPCPHGCPYGKVCNDASGVCVDDPCTFRECQKGQWCNPNDGLCEDDPCVGTMCPDPSQVCKGGTCYDPSSFLPDSGIESHVTVGGGGCNTSGDGTSALFVLGFGLVLWRRRGARK